MTVIVCLGDSFTEGMCDDLRADGNYLGWADRVALGLSRAALPGYPAPIRYANLAIRGKLLHQVIADQLPTALALRPDLVTFHAGPNDILRPGADAGRIGRDYERAVAELRACGAEVVLFTSITRSGGSGRVADRLEAKFEPFNEQVRAVAARHGCLLVDNARVPAITDRRLWAADRLHLAPEGHRRVAAKVLCTLGVADPEVLGGAVGWWERPKPPAEPASRPAALAADADWAARYLVPWIGRRLRRVSSGDGRAPKDPVLRTLSG